MRTELARRESESRAFPALDLQFAPLSSSGVRRCDRVFLSYSRPDETRVTEIYNLLEQACGNGGSTPKTSLGTSWRAPIERPMRRSKPSSRFQRTIQSRRGYFWMEMEIALRLAERRSRSICDSLEAGGYNFSIGVAYIQQCSCLNNA
jgi:hypothetical protein